MDPVLLRRGNRSTKSKPAGLIENIPFTYDQGLIQSKNRTLVTEVEDKCATPVLRAPVYHLQAPIDLFIPCERTDHYISLLC